MTLELCTRYLRFERNGSVGYCIIDRPERRNAMTTNMYLGVRRAIRHLESTDDLAALVITGVGDVFSAGGDLANEEEEGGTWAFETYGTTNGPYEAIRHCPKPVVAMVNGACIAGGLLMAIMCDVCVVSERAHFRIPEVLRGVADAYWAAYLPAHVGIARARDLLLRGRSFNAQEALAMGLITQVVPHGELEAATYDVVRDLVRAAPSARSQVKRMVNDHYGAVEQMTLASSLVGSEGQEGFTAFVEKRAPSWVPPEFRSGRL
jgi:enoyl-CoA hydratase/carnithine racemase